MLIKIKWHELSHHMGFGAQINAQVSILSIIVHKNTENLNSYKKNSQENILICQVFWSISCKNIHNPNMENIKIKTNFLNIEKQGISSLICGK